MISPGRVFLVGAGPGHPDLMTLKAHRLLMEAEVVIYDRLVGDAIIALIPEHAERIYVGKAPGEHSISQPEINALIVAHAKQGKMVVRLKGGDPLIFARGAEELLALVEAGIPFEIVPGVTAAAGCGAYAGIPLTHRGMSTSLRVVTGHFRDGGTLDLNWKSMADPNTTLVFYMGLTYMEEIATQLMQAGLSPDTPAAAIQEGTRPTQRVITGTLATIGALTKNQEFRPPTLIIVGKVVAFAEQFGWNY